jgi:hypothetical protein
MSAICCLDNIDPPTVVATDSNRARNRSGIAPFAAVGIEAMVLRSTSRNSRDEDRTCGHGQ